MRAVNALGVSFLPVSPRWLFPLEVFTFKPERAPVMPRALLFSVYAVMALPIPSNAIADHSRLDRAAGTESYRTTPVEDDRGTSGRVKAAAKPRSYLWITPVPNRAMLVQ